MRPFACVVMGVTGSGKTTIARAFARATGAAFVEADDLHPPSNRARLERGQPLTDDDRWPWLHAVGQEIAARSATGSVVATCSALKRSYRDLLRTHVPALWFAYLHAPAFLVHARVHRRRSHFASPAIVPSQLSILEPPLPDEDAIVLDASASIVDLVGTLRAALERRRPA